MLSSFISRLLLIRQFSILNGEFKILEKNFYFQPIKSLAIFQEKLWKKSRRVGLELIYETSKEGFVDFIRDIKRFAESREKFFNVLLNLVTHFGFGNLEIIEVNEKEKKAVVEVKNNPFAKEYVKIFGAQKKCVDYMLAGIIAAYFSEFFEKNVECEEESCIAKRNLVCKFIVK
ncbi:MAG: 4-vinyl reductase [Candidatus Aenigmatarchaeota archaeon]